MAKKVLKSVSINSSDRTKINDNFTELYATAGTTTTSSAAELNFNDGSVAGTAVASKTVVLDSSKNHAGISNLTLGAIGASGVVGKVVLSDGANPGYKASVYTDAQSADLNVHIPDPGNMTDAYVPLSTAALTAVEVDVLDGATAGTVVASKAVVVDASKDITGLRNVTTEGIVTIKDAHSGLLIGCGASGSPYGLGATGDNAKEYYLDATHTTGDMRGEYLRLYFSGAGGSGEAFRSMATVNGVSVATGGTVNGAHISFGTAGAGAAVSGAANAIRATFGIAAASTNIGGTCSVIQVDTDIATEATVPPNFAFLRFTNTGANKSNNLLRVPNVAAETGGLFCAHVTQTMTHSIKIVSEGGTAYYLMLTDANTNRTES